MVKRMLKLLEQMLTIPAVSSLESNRCNFLYSRIKQLVKEENLEDHILCKRVKNNIILYAQRRGKHRTGQCTMLLCAHIDTVPPSDKYSCPPFGITKKGEKLIGLGINDDGASVISMLAAFVSASKTAGGCNLMLSLNAQEETGGPNGLPAVLKFLKSSKLFPYPDFAVVGEPTGMKAAIAEKGLLVLDRQASGTSSHAALDNPDNAIYNAIADINLIKRTRFRRRSKLTGAVHLTVTQINAGSVHNVVPEKCNFVVDIRPNEKYTNKEIWQILQTKVKSRLTPRNLQHKVSVTPNNHILMKTVLSLGMETFISSSFSDWARLDIPAVKIGPGNSLRSHKADEYITEKELTEGINGYKLLIEAIDEKLMAKQKHTI